MNYASDPLWAYKQGYGPEQRQAYENQVMADRADRERHRSEFDFAAVAGGAALLGSWFQSRAARKQARAREEFEIAHRPQDYDRRRMEYGMAISHLESDVAWSISKLEVEIARLEASLPQAGTAKTHRTIRARLDALRAMVETKRLVYTSTLESLSMRYRDVLEYDTALASLS